MHGEVHGNSPPWKSATAEAMAFSLRTERTQRKECRVLRYACRVLINYSVSANSKAAPTNKGGRCGPTHGWSQSRNNLFHAEKTLLSCSPITEWNGSQNGFNIPPSAESLVPLQGTIYSSLRNTENIIKWLSYWLLPTLPHSRHVRSWIADNKWSLEKRWTEIIAIIEAPAAESPGLDFRISKFKENHIDRIITKEQNKHRRNSSGYSWNSLLEGTTDKIKVGASRPRMINRKGIHVL